MTNLYIKGPDALAPLTYLDVNSFATFSPGRAKQFVAVSGEGHYIGDAILFYLEDELFDLVGHPMALDWVQLHVETGGFPRRCPASTPVSRQRLTEHGSTAITSARSYLASEREMLSLASIDITDAEPGTEVIVVWGELPNSTQPNVEQHRQLSIRATVEPAPYVTFARLSYRADA